MATYSELMAQAQALMAQAEQARKAELAAVIADIKAKMKEYGITVADLGSAGSGQPQGGQEQQVGSAGQVPWPPG